ncbi:MAG TPA: helicase HerA-like domain-containing protein [Kofleriaceae bacterium]|nr:helicase HerA-like domain-containing protein [Kofleriaceae bacterium]
MEERTEPELRLGTRRDAPDAPVGLPAGALLRHALALGSSGSGKTVFCKVVVEEAVRAGVPVIALDPQGDLASLALAPEAEDDPVAAELFARIDPVVFTPASRKGVPLCADPVHAGLARLEPTERAHAVTRTAARITSLLGYDLESDDGAGLTAVIDHAMNEMLEAGRAPTSLREVVEAIESGPDRFSRYLAVKRIRAATQRAARLDVGARRLMFHEGVPIDIDLLLGRRRDAAPPPGKTRVSIIFLNTLHGQEDKEFFVAAIADRLYAWMLANPSPDLQAIFYIDEVAPFIPPVRKPACKEDLAILYKQARKFGVGCIAATQNPGDLDYKAMGQFGTWALGRLATRQDLKKVEPALRALVPDAAPILDALPSLRPGELVIVAPDHFDAPCPLATRRLLTPHRTLDEEAVSALSAAIRPRFAPLELARPAEPALKPTDVGALIEQTLDRLAPELRAAGIAVEKDLQPAPKVNADAEWIRGALLNLFLNAREAMPQGGALAVRLRPNAELVEIQIEDSGLGMDDATRRQLFRPFFTTRRGGTGLGLAIVKRVIEDHRGAISVDSRPGKGSRFILTLPM